MISRYSRRPVSHNLEIRGLSRSSLDHHHPLPEEADDDLVPQPLLHDLREAVSAYNSSETSAASVQSDCPTVTTGDSARSWSGIHSYAGTGISTERSSVFSWGYDEFDKAASRQVQQMFEEIDEELYEGRGGGLHLRGLQDECQQWASRFPHLRILGSQLMCPSDEGFQWFSTSGRASTPSPGLAGAPASGEESRPQDKDKQGTELCVQGRRAVFSKPCVVEMEPPPGCEADHSPQVIEAEGLMEEYLAYDSRDLDEERDSRCPDTGRRRPCLPPVSPYRCRRQAVLDLLFDDVWHELIGWMEELVRRHWEGYVSDDEKTSVSFSLAQPDSQNPFLLLSSALPTMLPRLGQARPPHLTASLQQQSSRVPVGATVTQTHHNLNDLIVIHGIPLQQRTLGVFDRNLDPDENASQRPGSSAVPSSKPRPRRALEQSSSSLSRPPQSARRRNPPPRTLLPLAPSLTQPSATGSMDEVIRGTRLPTASDRLTSPPMPLSRNTLLPPIGTGDAENTHALQHSRHLQRQRGSSSRAHSAVTEEASSLLPRDRHHLLDVFSRPNTTHTYRSDTPYRRSFTVLDNIGRPGRASVGTDSLGIGVTGVSLGIGSSSFLDSFIHHPLGHSPIEDEEEPQAQAPPTVLLVPVSVPARAYSRGGITSRSSKPGL
ncbi:protein FAM149B1 isoform X2 [Hypomesus transpacificus]|uniref:protein FAM149B1 isoform X2 n=1 Tax=Hypomesus transpacificus TaxID=137520 RepID=UPI001F079DB8|nr:protein FAM149B1 isoform X2 [Hypomesus transpacificus]